MRWKLAVLAALALTTAAGPACAQSIAATTATFDPQDPRNAKLYALQDAAEDLQNTSKLDAAGVMAIIAEWEKLHTAALAAPLADGSPHPLAALADIKIASQLYAIGELPEASARGHAGIERLTPFVSDYPLAFAEGVALVSLMMSQGGQSEEALPLAEKGHADFTAYFDTLGPAQVDRATGTAKSNLEFAISQILLRLGRNEESMSWQRASLETRRTTLGETDPDTISAMYSLAQTLLKNELTDEAEATARKAVELAVAHVDPTHPSYARALEMLGIILSRTGRPIEGTDYLTQALALKRQNEGGENLYYAYGVHNLGTILLNRERYEDAEGLFVDADVGFRAAQGEESPFAAGSIAYAGRISYVEGRGDEAIGRFEQALAQLGDNLRDDQILANIQPDLARALLDAGRNAEALDIARSYRDLIASLDNQPAFALGFSRLLYQQAALQAGAGSLDAAQAAAETLLRVVSAAQAANPTGFLQLDQRDALDLIMQVAVEAMRPDLMVRSINLMNSSSIALASRRRAGRLAAASPELADALRGLQDASLKFDEADGAYLSLVGKGEDATAARQIRDEAYAALQAAQSGIDQRFPEWSASIAGGGTTPEALAASLAPGEAILAVAPAFHNAYLLLITREGASAWLAKGNRAHIIDLARKLGEAVRGGSFDVAASQALYALLFPHEVRARLAGIDTLRILAGGELASLPFAVLQSAEDGEWLIDRLALASVADLAPAVHDDGERDGSEFVAVADTVPYSAAAGGSAVGEADTGITRYFDRGGANRAALAELPRLPRSAAEAESIARFIGPDHSRLLLGADADEAHVRGGALEDASIILFATHGLVSGEIEGVAEPALVLSPPGPGSNGDDGLLTASEIADLQLDARWIVLSACNSASPGGAGLPAFTGIAQAFRHAGGDTLMVSHWQVRDDVAAFLTIETLKGYRAGLSKPKALQAAVRKLRGSSGIAGANQPFNWAPFILLE